MEPETVAIWQGRLSTEDTHYQAYWHVLDEAERNQARKFTNELLHKRYVETHGRLRNLLAAKLDKSPELLKISKGEYGKPFLPDHPDLAFNLSHTADNLIIAIGWNCQLGVDIEDCKKRTNLSGLVEKCFAVEEVSYWRQLPEDLKLPAFYRFWTRKEAFVKATGYGITLGLNQCVINPKNPTEFLNVPGHCGKASAWHALEIDSDKGISGALVSDKKFTSVELIKLTT